MLCYKLFPLNAWDNSWSLNTMSAGLGCNVNVKDTRSCRWVCNFLWAFIFYRTTGIIQIEVFWFWWYYRVKKNKPLNILSQNITAELNLVWNLLFGRTLLSLLSPTYLRMQNITSRLAAHSNWNQLQTDGFSYSAWLCVTIVKKKILNPVKT